MRLIFIRHGEPDYTNDCLTENGRVQAQATARRLKGEGIKAIYSSPMGRAKETASYTAREYGLDIQVLDFMHEIDWGSRPGSTEELEYGGHPWSLGYRLLAEHPDCVGNSQWVDHPYFRDNICMDYYEKVSKGIDGFLAGYGLLRQDGLYKCGECGDDTIALFAHGGSGAILLSHILNLPFPFVLVSMPYGVCSVSAVEFKNQRGDIIVPRLELFNDMGHIDSFKLEKLNFEK
jgi:probable phosphoglycerate mutase